MKNIYFISESVPYPSYGSYVIFYRHLIRLENEGYNITVIIPTYKSPAIDEFIEVIKYRWTIIKMPPNKWWFLLPYRFEVKWLRTIRFWFMCLYINIHFKNHINKYPPHFILSYFYMQCYNGLAIFLKKKYNGGLGVFLHDDKYLLGKNNSASLLAYDQYVYQNADVVWTVSDKLFIPETDKHKYKLLYPIPAGGDISHRAKTWTDDYVTPVVGFSGTINIEYESIVNLLATELNNYEGKLILIVRDPSSHPWLLALKAKHKNITIVEAFADINDAINYLRNNCTALFCGYPDEIEQMPWISSCFPSKFIEYSHLGLPIILTSPPDTALADWAIKYNWNLFSSSYSSADFKKIIEGITQKNNWEENGNQTTKIANTIFNPDDIHESFLASVR